MCPRIDVSLVSRWIGRVSRLSIGALIVGTFALSTVFAQTGGDVKTGPKIPPKGSTPIELSAPPASLEDALQKAKPIGANPLDSVTVFCRPPKELKVIHYNHPVYGEVTITTCK
jgi:hypothetical protein